jgi:hypothetical protein
MLARFFQVSTWLGAFQLTALHHSLDSYLYGAVHVTRESGLQNDSATVLGCCAAASRLYSTVLYSEEYVQPGAVKLFLNQFVFENHKTANKMQKRQVDAITCSAS